MRSFFSRLLVMNWGFLTILTLAVLSVFYFSTNLLPELQFLLFMVVWIFAFFGTFHISYKISENVAETLRLLQNKTQAVNAGDFSPAVIMTDLREFDELSKSIDAMSSRLKIQFIDLNLEKEKFNLVLQNLKEGLFALDAKGNIQFVNRSVPKSFVSENSIGKHISKAVPDRRIVKFLEERLMTGIDGRMNFDYRKKHYSIRVHILKSESRGPLLIGVILDRTEDRKNELLREEFFQNASHELKTPITSIKGYAETLYDRLNADEKSPEKKFLGAILRNTDRMVTLVDDMIKITQLESSEFVFQPEEFPLEDLMENLKYSVEGLLERKKQTLEIIIPEDFSVFGDMILLEHLLLNLIQNASAYSGENTVIRVEALQSEYSQEIKVSDQGIGISDENISRIFERFYRADTARSRKEGGTGLGLSIVKQIAKLHSGWIDVKSEPEKGSTFSLQIPREKK